MSDTTADTGEDMLGIGLVKKLEEFYDLQDTE